MSVKFEDNSRECLSALEQAEIKFLHEAKDLIANEAAKNTPVDSGRLKRSFLEDSEVDRGSKTAYIGSTLEYAIYQEKGTGEYAAAGRKGGWAYKDAKGKWHFTKGSKPHHMLEKAFNNKRSKVQAQGQKVLSRYMKWLDY